MESLSDSLWDIAENFNLPFTLVLDDTMSLMTENPNLTLDELLCKLFERYEKEKPFMGNVGQSSVEGLATKTEVYHISITREADGSIDPRIEKDTRTVAEQLNKVTGAHVIVSDDRIKVTKL